MKSLSLAVVGVALALAGCTGTDMPWDGPRAVAALRPTQGNTVTGEITFTQKGSKTLVTGEVRGLAPGREHGFHVHEKGDCSAADGMSAGGHFNPMTTQHGNYAMSPHHSGDMPNIKADANGVARISWEDDELTVKDGPASVVGRAVIVHRDPDDYKSQPAGNSGPRLACGVIAKS
jgi:Cu-Zn family superoxide dismutase